MDNQREGHFIKKTDPDKIKYDFCPDNGDNYQYNNEAIKSIEENILLKNLIPAGLSKKQAQKEIDGLIESYYDINVDHL